MIFARPILGQELVLLCDIGLAMGLVYTYLRWRGQLSLLRRVWPPALLWTIFGTLDALVTIVGTWGDPYREANPILRAWLIRDGWVGQLIYTFFWVLLWSAVVVGLEEVYRRVGGVWASLLGATQLLVLYTLAVEHASGFLSWTPYLQPIWPLITSLNARAPWLFANSLGLFLTYALILGAIFTAAQLAISALLRRMGSQAPVASQAQELVARSGQTAEH